MENAYSSGVIRIPPQSGKAFKLKQGNVLRVYDPFGEQVADLFAFQDGDLSCSLSSGRSLDYAGKIYLSTGDLLYSNNSKPMFSIVFDSVGRHDFLLTPCSQEMFEILYHHHGHHPSCFENLCTSFADFKIEPSQISTTFNIFMKVNVDFEGKLSVETPSSRAGDFIDFRAEMDLICALTSCSAEKSNNGSFKPIDYEIIKI